MCAYDEENKLDFTTRFKDGTQFLVIKRMCEIFVHPAPLETFSKQM